MWDNDKVDVKRNVKTGTSDSGEDQYELSTIIENMSCNIQVVEVNSFPAEAGTTTLVTKRLTCDNTFDIKNEDIVVDKKDDSKYKVISVVPLKLFPRLEIKMLGGVL